ncbi:endolytic transglycosylase MltG [Saccharomonospora piscinae]|uniref:endolytic transglycosylase MltG n=1 Tax=Saccharomonospora piscinae TaxID=687388 RepID=UPI000466A43F|nr:endolytic transglycosylase MltG [Saccharomonospora piscinae]
MRPGPPPGRPPRRRRRPSPNDGVPPDENPTEVLRLDDDAYDDLYDEELGYDGRDDYDDYYDDDYYYDEDDDLLDDADDQRDGRRAVSSASAEDGDRAEPEYFGDDRDLDDEEPPRGGRGRRLLKWIAALLLLAVLAGGSYFGARELLGFGYEDYDGPGEGDVILHVEDGDVTSVIARKLAELDAVASAEAFLAAGESDQRLLSVQPGYYQVKSKMSGESAVSALVADEARVGHLQIRAGTQLSDVIQPDDSVTPGVFSLLSKASCATVNGESTCVSPEELRETADTVDPAELGLPDWAARDAAEAEEGRTLEGLIAPGVYDVRPGSDARELLSQVLDSSVTRLEAAGLPGAADDLDYSPYEVLVIASIIEKEAVKADFGKVSSVIDNRMEIEMPLGMDSTVNYLLERPELTTDDEARANQGPYNTYESIGLPPTPIASPSAEAIAAALKPEDTDYVYFVKCEKNGLSCFNVEYEDHLADRDDARARDVY